MKRPSPLILNLAISIIFILLAITICEFALRQFTRIKSYEEKNGGAYRSPWGQNTAKGWLYVYSPNSKGENRRTEFTNYVHANNIGLNDRDFNPKTDSAIRIALLGDSFTEGIGSIGDSAYFQILRTILPHSEVMGCGVSGSDPVFEYMLLKQRLLWFHPNIITVAINYSDINDVIVRGGFDRFLPGGKIKVKYGPRWEFLFAKSYVARVIARGVFRMDYFFLTPAQRVVEEKKSSDILESTIDSIQALCDTNNIRCIFLFHPYKEEIVSDRLYCAPILNYARERGCETIDLFSYFKTHGVNPNNLDTYYWPIDGHNKNKGYALFAQAIKEYLAQPVRNFNPNGSNNQ